MMMDVLVGSALADPAAAPDCHRDKLAKVDLNHFSSPQG